MRKKLRKIFKAREVEVISHELKKSINPFERWTVLEEETGTIEILRMGSDNEPFEVWTPIVQGRRTWLAACKNFEELVDWFYERRLRNV